MLESAARAVTAMACAGRLPSDVLDRIAETPVGGPTRELPIAPVELIAAIVLPVKK
jgi:hypothetical protein